MKAQARASAGHKSAGHKKLKHMILKQAENGVVAEHHFQEPAPTGGHYMPPPEPEMHAITSSAQLGKHVKAHFPMGTPDKAPMTTAPATNDGDTDDEAA